MVGIASITILDMERTVCGIGGVTSTDGSGTVLPATVNALMEKFSTVLADVKNTRTQTS